MPLSQVRKQETRALGPQSLGLHGRAGLEPSQSEPSTKAGLLWPTHPALASLTAGEPRGCLFHAPVNPSVVDKDHRVFTLLCSFQPKLQQIFFFNIWKCFPIPFLSWPGLAQMVKYLPAKQETRVQCLGQEDPLEEGMVTHSSILAWRIPWTEEPGGLQSMGSQRVRHGWATNTVTFSMSPPPWPLPCVHVPSLLRVLTELRPCPSQWFWNSASSSQSAESLKVRTLPSESALLLTHQLTS